MSRKTRKLIWSAPLVALLAVAGALAIFAAMAPNEAQADHIELPGPPQNVMAEADGARAINLTWDPPEDDGGSAITGYRIDYLDMGSGNIWRELVASTPGTSYTDMDGLDPEEERAYRVFAMNALGTGAVSDVVFEATDMAGTATPGQVITFHAPAADGPTKINLSWVAPEKSGDTPISSYRIHIARAGTTIPASDGSETVTKAEDVGDLNLAVDAATAVIDTGSDATSYTLMGLRARHTWQFQIYARNDDGNSEDGSPVRIETTGDPIAPAKPTEVRAVSTAVDATDTNVIRLYWYWPEHDGGADIANFRVEVRQSGKAWPSPTDGDSTDVNADLTGDDGHAVITAPLNTANSHEYEHTGISADLDEKVLEYRVFTQTATGPPRRSSASNVASATVNAGNSIAGATDVAATAGSGTLSLNWTAPSGAGTGYLIDYTEEPAAGQPLKWMRLERNTIFSELPYVHENLMAGTSYEYRVFAHPIRRGIGSNVSDAVEPNAPATTVPGKPRNLTGTVVNAGQIDLNWDAPTSDGGDEITSYRVHLAPTTGTLAADTALTDTDGTADGVQPPTDFEAGTAAVLDTDSADTMYSLKGLRAQQTWQIAVVAHNGQTGTNVLSDIIIVTMPIFEKPAMPVGLLAESAVDSNLLSRNERGVLLLWNQPEAPAGAEITKYEIKRKVNDGEFLDLFTLDAGASPSTFSTFDTDETEPKEDEVRMYRVRTVAKATSAATEEMMSDWAEVRYPADTMMAPGAPTLSAMKDSAMPASQINLTWTKPDNAYATVTGYIIERAYGDVMFLDRDEDGAEGNKIVAHPDYAFSDHMEWWETLDCGGMLDAVGSDADPAMDSDDKAMYCKHYAMSGPTADMTFPAEKLIEADSAVDMKIEEYFDKRYEVITDATKMSHEDTGLMENTEYSYRIRAAHGMDAGMWSNTAMAMTDVLNTDLMPLTNVRATSTVAGEITITWEGGENADSYVLVALDVAGYEAGNARYYETASIDDGTATMGEVSALTSGTEYQVLVIAIKGTGADEEYAFGFGTESVTAQ